ncbi:MAG: response regulator transcription factor [Cyanobacteria bacterium P01_A01_bin.135]
MDKANPIRVLIVEDDPMMLLGLEQSLASQPNIDVIGHATDGRDAVDAAQRLTPEVIVMDIGLPLINGIEATEQIKAVLPSTRVVMLTSHTLETEVIGALASGADAYCVKGTSVTGLLRAIAAVREGASYFDPQVARTVMKHLKTPVDGDKVAAMNQLSEREMDVLKLMVEGLSNPEIATELYLSPNTIKTHVRGIMNKLAVDDRVQAAVTALRSGVLE